MDRGEKLTDIFLTDEAMAYSQQEINAVFDAAPADVQDVNVEVPGNNSADDAPPAADQPGDTPAKDNAAAPPADTQKDTADPAPAADNPLVGKWVQIGDGNDYLDFYNSYDPEVFGKIPLTFYADGTGEYFSCASIHYQVSGNELNLTFNSTGETVTVEYSLKNGNLYFISGNNYTVLKRVE